MVTNSEDKDEFITASCILTNACLKRMAVLLEDYQLRLQ
jgi:hypothetical protein